MYSFQNDYAEGAHPQILKRLLETNLEQAPGYGEDEFSKKAKRAMQKAMDNPQADIHFVSGGTQANLVVIASLLQTHEAVISAETGHIYDHETGAIEACGHRIIPVKSSDGKLTPALVEEALAANAMRPHTVKPRLVYISNSTELGTIYSERELMLLYDFCRSKDLFLFMDGARLGAALTAEINDLTLSKVSYFTDVFTVGATKNGGLLGEAIVFGNPNIQPDFDYITKQKGALMAKGRLLGIQFLELFTDELYFKSAQHANAMAKQLSEGIAKQGYRFLTSTESNQVFPIFPREKVNQLRARYDFHDWKQVSTDEVAVRLVCSWATKAEAVQEFLIDLQA